uniref:Uncharacterized protein n=1 Tax=Physcomitrium patens TaxID=3218 RepID=A0A2K1KI49_PHYPA|nr:hypothetical protein PHYPA_007108 [Physcomitrium patens]
MKLKTRTVSDVVSHPWSSVGGNYTVGVRRRFLLSDYHLITARSIAHFGWRNICDQTSIASSSLKAEQLHTL